MRDLLFDVSNGGVATITLNAPARRNCLNLAMSKEIVDLCAAIDANTRIGAAIVQANGPVFCSGADRDLLAEVGKDPTSNSAFRNLTTIYEAFARIERLAVPTIAAVQGIALGAGLNLAMSADICLVADDARLTGGFLQIGVHPGGGHFTLVSRKAGPQTAAALSIFGQSFVGQECVTAGLALAAIPSRMLATRAAELAAQAGADPDLSRRAIASFRAQAYTGLSQDLASRTEHAAQMWSLRRRDRGVRDADSDAAGSRPTDDRSTQP